MSLFYASVKPSQLVLMVVAAAAKKKNTQNLIGINYLFVAEIAQWWNISWKWFQFWMCLVDRPKKDPCKKAAV